MSFTYAPQLVHLLLHLERILLKAQKLIFVSVRCYVCHPESFMAVSWFGVSKWVTQSLFTNPHFVAVSKFLVTFFLL